MNRLILIGNGFDLAHGLKTSYIDFILSYLKECCINAVNHNGSYRIVDRYTAIDDQNLYEDILVTIKLKSKYTNIPYEQSINSCSTLSELFDLLSKYGFIKTLKSSFIQKTISHCESFNWVDIENQYFQHLLLIKNNYYKNEIKYKAELQQLNNELDFISLKLEKYLKSLSIEENNFEFKTLANMVTSPILKDEIVTLKLENNINPSNIYFLNFNYTQTLNPYLQHLSYSVNVASNHIHGTLNNKINPIIFGFGDEIDKAYNEIEELNENEFFKHIKSFKYFRTSSYHDLIRFTEAEDYQIYIIGHSCGLSDRTLLSQIFEHKNCKSIKIFYYLRPDGTNDYIEKTFDISRHFKNKGVMRKKIVPFANSYPIPKIQPLFS